MSTIHFLRKNLSFAKPFLEALFSIEARASEWWAAGAHHRLFLAQWGILPVPEFFEHKVGLYWSWKATRSPLFVERGVFSLLAMKPNCKALELCCGDGFNAHYFYSFRAGSILSVDFDPKAIAYANRNFQADNVTYRLADIRTQLPEGIFDNIIWDAAIEHFTPDEIVDLVINIKKRLGQNGVLSGYTMVEGADGKMALPHHEYEFKSKEDLARFFLPHFQNVTVFETIYPDRHNLYFWASDGVIPFMDQWDAATAKPERREVAAAV
jgi:ubiquinone/menaquinone biosynthesis C-methylase UbiE